MFGTCLMSLINTLKVISVASLKCPKRVLQMLDCYFISGVLFDSFGWFALGQCNGVIQYFSARNVFCFRFSHEKSSLSLFHLYEQMQEHGHQSSFSWSTCVLVYCCFPSLVSTSRQGTSSPCLEATPQCCFLILWFAVRIIAGHCFNGSCKQIRIWHLERHSFGHLQSGLSTNTSNFCLWTSYKIVWCLSFMEAIYVLESVSVARWEKLEVPCSFGTRGNYWYFQLCSFSSLLA